MKNKDILLDVIGETDEKLVPELTEKQKKNSTIKWIALGTACAAAAIAGFVMLPKSGGIDPSSSIGRDSSSNTSKAQTSSIRIEIPLSEAGKAELLAAPVYPEMPAYPDETAYSDWEAQQAAYEEWHNARRELQNQPEGYDEGFDSFFVNSTRAFLTGRGNDNTVYSPLSLYMALGMSAEISGGNTRRQILDALAQSDIETLRKHSRSIWQANYMDDGMAKCVLANSLWTSIGLKYNTDTVNNLAEIYYSSVYSGDPASEEYNALFQSWLNEQTDGLLTDYAEGLEFTPEMVLSLASTVNFSGKWFDTFSVENTEQGTFHSPEGDVQVDFMNDEKCLDYSWGDSFAAVSLPLENNGQMKLILPDEGYTPEELLSDEQAIDYMLSQWNYANSKYPVVNISVPKFDVSSSMDLNDGLEKLGITDIFDSGKADLSPICEGAGGIALSKAEQDSRVMIDEEGCKAASLTVMMYAGAGMPEEQVDFVVDRPFIFEIMSQTGLPLFVGIVNTP